MSDYLGLPVNKYNLGESFDIMAPVPHLQNEDNIIYIIILFW